jgi:hypothetical protein
MTMKPAELWENLERFATPAAVLAEWQEILGGDFAAFQGFLRPTDDLALEYPCTNRPSCACRHEVVPLRMVAACRCEPRDCESIVLEPKDVLVYALDTRKLCGAVRAPLGFEPPPDDNAVVDGTRGTWPVGTYGQTRSPVFLTVRLTESDFVEELERLVSGQSEPFILLAPTERHKTSTVQGILQRQRCAFVPLCSSLALAGGGRFTATGSIQPILDRFGQGLAEGKGLVKTVEKMGRDIAAVAQGNYELRKENEELRTLQKEGFFKFALKVDGEDFRAFAVIMALGNRKAAADFLKVPHRSFYDRVEKWSARGKDYQQMARYVDWRKRSSRKIKLRLDDSVQSGEPNDAPENPETIGEVLDAISADDSRDYPAILRQVLETLRAQNGKNWAAVRAELLEMIEEEVPQ